MSLQPQKAHKVDNGKGCQLTLYRASKENSEHRTLAATCMDSCFGLAYPHTLLCHFKPHSTSVPFSMSSTRLDLTSVNTGAFELKLIVCNIPTFDIMFFWQFKTFHTKGWKSSDRQASRDSEEWTTFLPYNSTKIYWHCKMLVPMRVWHTHRIWQEVSPLYPRCHS